MLNYLWTAMLLIGVTVGAVTGKMEDVSNAFINSAQDAVNLCITMLGVMAMWSGVMKIAQNSGLLEQMTRRLMPVLKFLFPEIPEGHPAGGYIATNCVANILGLGWAATPAGLKAMESLGELERERQSVPRGTASNEMCTFLILNISSLQLIPVNIIAYRSQYDSLNPTAVVGPAILATTVSTLTAILYCRWKNRHCVKWINS